MQIASWLGRGRLPETCWLTGARSGVPAPGLRHPGSGLLRCPNCGLLARSARVTLERDLRTAGLSADQLQTAHDPARSGETSKVTRSSHFGSPSGRCRRLLLARKAGPNEWKNAAVERREASVPERQGRGRFSQKRPPRAARNGTHAVRPAHCAGSARTERLSALPPPHSMGRETSQLPRWAYRRPGGEALPGAALRRRASCAPEGCPSRAPWQRASGAPERRDAALYAQLTYCPLKARKGCCAKNRCSGKSATIEDTADNRHEPPPGVVRLSSLPNSFSRGEFNVQSS